MSSSTAGRELTVLGLCSPTVAFPEGSMHAKHFLLDLLPFAIADMDPVASLL